MPGQAARYTFPATAGAIVTIDASGPPTTGVAYVVLGPDGRRVGTNPFAGDDMSTQLAATGDHTLVVSSYAGGRAAYALHVTTTT